MYLDGHFDTKTSLLVGLVTEIQLGGNKIRRKTTTFVQQDFRQQSLDESKKARTLRRASKRAEEQRQEVEKLAEMSYEARLLIKSAKRSEVKLKTKIRIDKIEKAQRLVREESTSGESMEEDDPSEAMRCRPGFVVRNSHDRSESSRPHVEIGVR